MRRFLLLVLLVFTGVPVAAQTLPEVVIAPMPAWVRPAELAAPDPAAADRPAQALLTDAQSLYAADHADHYIRVAFLIQNLEGLQGLGNVVLPWPSGQADLIVHSVQIIRNGEVIDLLARGQRFTVLRRENNLEAAMLDGMLTAVMQPEGLAIGDILSVSWTMRRRGATLPHRGENFFTPPTLQPVRRINIRQIWPRDLPIQWRGSGSYERATVADTPLGRELSLALTDASPLELPGQLPGRFAFASTLQLSQYRDWAEISAQFAPHYERATQLAPDSPLRAEIDRIANASSDPGARAMAALRLVQGQVRYFALLMGEGGYLPATAEQSWARRYADCKGKTVLLVALLRELGIEAEAALVHSEAGDALPDRLPMLNAFNHMIVHARIAGRSYWLDGTRSGDMVLEDLTPGTFGWALPIRAGGAALERVEHRPPERPMIESIVTYDASGGLTGSVPLRVEQIFRGREAAQMRSLIARLGREAFLRQMREANAAQADRSITEIDLRDSPEAGELALILSGSAPLAWNPVAGTRPSPAGPRRFRFSSEGFAHQLDVQRPEGPFRDAPVAIPEPFYFAATETMLLPAGMSGASIDGQDIDEVVAGVRFIRRVRIENGRAVSRFEQRSVEREFPAAALVEARARLSQLRHDFAYVRVPGAALRRAAR